MPKVPHAQSNPMNLILDNPIYRIVGQTADSMGIQAFAVGGVVRDHLLQRPCTDIDIVCLGNGIDLAQATAQLFHST